MSDTALSRSERSRYLVLALPAILMMGVFFAIPLLQVLWLSVSEPRLGFENYQEIATNPLIARIWMTTLRVCLITTVISVVFGYVVAYAMTVVGPRQRMGMIFCILATFSFSVLVRAFAFVVLLRTEGILNEALLAMGLIHQPLRLLRNEVGVVIGMAHYGLPVAILALYSNLRGINAKLMDAARGLGASGFQAFRVVYLPLSVPGILAASVLVFVYSLGFFIIPALLGGGRVVMIAEYIRVGFEETLRWGYATMLATTLVAVVLILLAVMSRFVDLRKAFG
ncbi:ABC transporter permease [Roseixanthobacter pseudopolyaromaticivorans]|uniref:ABC transporter permease n=1 Tax=Xanthobacteraceae TaxID=335928 RepID=UPI0037298F1E